MKISRRDKMLLLILLVAVVFTLSYFLVIKNLIDDFFDNTAAIVTVEVQAETVKTKLLDEDLIKEKINQLLSEESISGNYFMSPMTTYEADRFMQAIMTECGVEYSNISISDLQLNEIKMYSYTKQTLTYPLLDIISESSGGNNAGTNQNTVDDLAVMLPSLNIQITYSANIDSLKMFLDSISKNNQRSIIINSLAVNPETSQGTGELTTEETTNTVEGNIENTDVAGTIDLTLFFMEPHSFSAEIIN